MLHTFLIDNHDEIVRRARKRVAGRTAPRATEVELTNGIPVFLKQLGDALKLAQSSDAVHHEAIAATAASHARDLLQMGLTVGQVVHDYGDVCQVVSELIVEQQQSIDAAEFRVFNLCLDDAIAGAVTEYADQVQRTTAARETERLGSFSHELRNLVNIALLSFDTIKQGRVGPSGSTGDIHGRSLMRLRDLVDRSLAQVRLDSSIPPRLEPLSVTRFIEEVEIGASIQARAKGIHFTVGPVDPTLTIQADRQTLASALSNLLQNAFKFTPAHGKVSLTIHASADRVLMEVEDECGGLPAGGAETLFRPFEQRSSDRSGLGLGLSISAKAAKANAGEIRVRDLPGRGCVFTLDLPRVPHGGAT
jgi:signal transduction histidine kinase